jgi:hypothetical protein
MTETLESAIFRLAMTTAVINFEVVNVHYYIPIISLQQVDMIGN